MTLLSLVESPPKAAGARSQTESVAATRCKGPDDVVTIGCTSYGYRRPGDRMPDIFGKPWLYGCISMNY
jgi:hypothetical protein